MIDHYTVHKENPSSWDEYFYRIASEAASNSKCLSRKIGAVIVNDNTIISAGYNGPPRGIRRCDERWLVDGDMRKLAIRNIAKNSESRTVFWKKTDDFEYITKNGNFFKKHLEGKCPRYVPEMGFKSGEGLEWCVAGHAERNAMINAARLGLYALKGCKMYMTCGVPCTPCMVEILNAGISELIVTQIEDAFYDQSSMYLLKESKISIRIYDFIKE